MTDDTDELADLFLDISGEETLTETQEEGHSHAPIEDGRDEIPDVTRDGLEDAVDASFDHSEGGG